MSAKKKKKKTVREKLESMVRKSTRRAEVGAGEGPVRFTSVGRLQDGWHKYEIGDVIAEGGMGVVRLAKDKNSRRVVAIKILPKYEDMDEQDFLRFIEEAQITSQLEHPNIIPFYELGCDPEGNAYYTMKYMKGLTLADILEGIRNGNDEGRRLLARFPLRRMLEIFCHVCDAISFAHSRRVVHRDLKPENIIVGDYGEVVVMDWGLAKVLTPEMAEAPPVDTRYAADAGEIAGDLMVKTDRVETGFRTMSGRVLGTPGFMAPEMVRERGREAGFAADIYSLGAVLYSILVLRPPVSGKDVHEVIRKVLAGEIVPPAERAEQLAAEGRALPHMPDGRVPDYLSEVCMRALSVDPGRRQESVRRLREEIGAWLEGRAWNLMAREEFEDNTFLRRWKPLGCSYEWRKGVLRLFGGERQVLLFRKKVRGDVRIEFECQLEGPYLDDVGCFIRGLEEAGSELAIPQTGYEFKFGGYENTMDVLLRASQRLWSKPDSPLNEGRIYRVVCEAVGSLLRMEVDGQEIFAVEDPEPLSGAGRTAIGLQTWRTAINYRSIRVYTRGSPWTRDILELAEQQLLKGRYQTARDLFAEVIESVPDEQRRRRARHGYRVSTRRMRLQERLPEIRRKLAEAWGTEDFTIGIQGDGLEIDISECGISDLSPLEGLPVRSLHCAGNNIGSLEPLRSLPLEFLDCSANPIYDLSPLAEMRLHTLICEDCRIRSLEPLRSAPLGLLNVAGNPVGTLKSLEKTRLSWLCCSNCGLRSLEPLRGMPLATLYCDGNLIDDLSPLSELPLRVLHCNYNSIVSLSPLKGLRLTTLHCAGNLVEDVSPLKGTALSVLCCNWNRIEDVDVLSDLPLSILLCAGNPLKRFHKIAMRPPYTFHFEADSIPERDLEWLRNAWARDFRYVHHAREVEVLLAVRRGNQSLIRELAHKFRNAEYVYVPLYVSWDDARRIARQLGGDLLVIRDAEENEFVASLFPRGCWFWMGLVRRGGKLLWVDGTPCNYTNFLSPVPKLREGPKVFASSGWSCDAAPEARNPFMIKWTR
ncbi:MAG: hypothetical protein DRP22_05270 [Verrucomicrobia bacterium]|nr:MAG: hypothetical protein DRP22_05270 [Verrucomicrobiota bacterium]